MKKINNILNMVICLVFGVFLGVTYDQYKIFLSKPDYFLPFKKFEWFQGQYKLNFKNYKYVKETVFEHL